VYDAGLAVVDHGRVVLKQRSGLARCGGRGADSRIGERDHAVDEGK
jgi:hypothetical protein